MCETADWDSAVNYDTFLKNARENVELMKARYSDLMLNESEQDTLSSIQNEIRILVIGTDRCDDSAGNVPVLARMTSLSPKLKLRILDSDKNAKLHEQYKVNGKRKTPVVLFMSNENQEICRWVERPNAAYKQVNQGSKPSLDDRKVALKKLYSDPEILRQSLGEFMKLLMRSDYVLGRH
ncbi:MAG: thioredoxin family protein [Candidatus Thorarchaeota archaeon]